MKRCSKDSKDGKVVVEDGFFSEPLQNLKNMLAVDIAGFKLKLYFKR